MANRQSYRRLQGAVALMTILAAAAGGTALEARADSTDTGQLVLLLKFKPGEALRYQTNMQLGFTLPSPTVPRQPPGAPGALGGTTFTVNASQDIKVRRAAATGGGDLDVTTTGQNTLPGQPPIISNDTRPVSMTYDAQGKLTAIRRSKEVASTNPMFSSMLGQGLLSMQGLLLPGKPVKIGETWTNKVQIPGVTGSSQSTIKTTLVRVEYLNKYRTAHLHVVISTPVMAYLDAALQPTAVPAEAACTTMGTAVVTDEINFAIAEGKVVRSIGKGNTNMLVTVGKPVLPDKPGKKKRQTPAAVPAGPVKPAQTLKMTVHTDIETNLVDGTKK